MVRSCCVPGCSSGKKVPSHKFPTAAKRKLQWFANIGMKPVQEEEVHKLRVCHKHFRDNDYSGSTKMRVLLSSAIPSRNEASEENTEMEDRANITEDKSNVRNTGNTEEIHATLEELSTQQQRMEKIVAQQQETLMQQQKEITQIQEKQEENRTTVQDVAALKHTVDQLVQQTQRAHSTRPYLQHYTRINALSPTARRLYNSTMKLQRNNKIMKKKLKKYREKSHINVVTLRSTDNSGRTDKTARIRQQFVDMMIRNDNVAPQVIVHSV